MIGDLLSGRYSINRLVGAGGCCSAYVGFDNNLEREVLVKALHSQALNSRMRDEISALQEIRSKFVVDLYDVIESGDDVYLVQEYLTGEPLESSVGTVDDRNHFLRLMFQIFSGLSEIHSAGYIHRDIKIGNMMFCSANYLKIYDFNLSRHESFAMTRGFKGTEVFAAPELYNDNTVKFTGAIDVYSAAVSMLALVHGVGYEKLREAIDSWNANSMNPFKEWARFLPESIVEVLGRCLSHDAEERPLAPDVKRVAEREMLFDMHRALLVYGDKYIEIDKLKREAAIRHGSVYMKIAYNGYDFVARDVQGEIYMNRFAVVDGVQLLPSSVVDLGQYVYMTVDISHPEVVL